MEFYLKNKKKSRKSAPVILLEPRKLAIVTLDYFIHDLSDIFRNLMVSDVNDITTIISNQQTTIEHLTHLAKFASWDKNEIIEVWCELCSEKFFVQYTDVDDLFINTGKSDDHQMCEWIASR